jgi:hypothetical protein
MFSGPQSSARRQAHLKGLRQQGNGALRSVIVSTCSAFGGGVEFGLPRPPIVSSRNTAADFQRGQAMSDDSNDDDGGGGGNSGFFGWFWNTLLNFLGVGNSGDDGNTDTTNPDKDGKATASANPSVTAAGDPTEGDAGTPVEVAPVNVTTTTAGADADDNPILPPGHQIGVWYQRVGDEWIPTDVTDERDLGLGEFAKDDGQGTTSIHYSGPDISPPDDPNMTGYIDSWKLGPGDVGDAGGAPNPNTWVYLYASVAALPQFLQPSDPTEMTWQVPSKDGSPAYAVFVQTNGQVQVWRTPP